MVMVTSFKRTYTSTPQLPGLLQPEPLSPQQATADPCLCRRHSNPQRQVWLQVLWRPLLHFLGPGAQGFVCALQASLEGMRFDSKCDCAPPTVLLGISFALQCRYLFLVGSNILLLMVVQQLVEILVFLQERWVHILLLFHLDCCCYCQVASVVSDSVQPHRQ